MPFSSPLEELDYTTYIDTFLNNHSGIKEYLKDKMSWKDGLLIIDIPRSFYKRIKFWLQNESLSKPEYLNPVFYAWTFADEMCSDQQETQLDLLQEAKEFYELAREHPPLQLTLSSDINFDNILKNLLENPEVKNIVIGEFHGDFGPLELLRNNTELLAMRNVLLVVENLCDTAQAEIDECFRNKKQSSLMEMLLPKMQYKNFNDANIFKIDVFKKLFEGQVRIVAGETELSNSVDIQSYQGKRSRITILNHTIIQNADRYKKINDIPDDTLTIYYVGQAHGLTENEAIGISELVNAVYIEVADDKRIEEHVITSKVKNNIPVYSINFSLKSFLGIDNDHSVQTLMPAYKNAKNINPITQFFSLSNSPTDAERAPINLNDVNLGYK